MDNLSIQRSPESNEYDPVIDAEEEGAYIQTLETLYSKQLFSSLTYNSLRVRGCR